MTVAVAYDATPQGRTAVDTAMEWANVYDTSVVVLHVEETGRAGTAGVSATPAATRAVQQAVEKVAASRLGSRPTPSWEVVSTTSAGDVASILLHAAATHGAQLIVIGSRPRTEIGKFFLGRVTQRVLLDSPVPVLVVKTE